MRRRHTACPPMRSNGAFPRDCRSLMLLDYVISEAGELFLRPRKVAIGVSP